MTGPVGSGAGASAGAPRVRRDLLLLLAITLLAGGLRWVVMEQNALVRFLGDENYYARTALNLAEGRGHVYVPPAGPGVAGAPMHAFRPPSQAFLLSLVVDRGRAPGGQVDLVTHRRFLALQVVLGTLLVLATGCLGRSLFDARAGLAAAGIVALYPTLVAYSHYLWSETLFGLLVVLSLLAATRLERSRSWALAAGAGVLFGLAALTREVALAVAVGTCAWLVARAGAGRRQQLLRCGVLLLVAGLTVLPWSLRNRRVIGRFVPVATVGSFAMREGNTFGDEGWLFAPADELRDFRQRYFATPGDAERMDLAWRETRELVRREQPAWLFEKLARTVTVLLWPDSFLFEKLGARRGEARLGPLRAALVVTVLAYLLVAALGAAGIAGSTAGGRRALALLLLGLVLAVHLVANASTRFRVPWMPFVAVYAGHALVQGRTLVGELSRGARIGLALFLAVLLLWCVPWFLPDLVSLWSDGTYAPRRG